MYITKDYWRWNTIYNDGEFFIGKVIMPEQITHLKYIENQANGTIIYKTTDENITFQVRNGIIIKQLFHNGGQIGQIYLERDFKTNVDTILHQYLEPCNKHDEGIKLIAIYADYILRMVILSL